MSKGRSAMPEPCQRCGAQTSVLIFDDFSLRKLCRVCFGGLVKTHQIPPHSLAKAQPEEPKEGNIQKNVIEE